MRFLSIFRSPEPNAPPSEAEQAAMGALMGEMAAAGVLVTAEGCKGTDRGMLVRRSGKDTTVTDGPFTEAKEVVGGFAILECATREEAIAWTRRFQDVVGDGESELRELYDAPAFDRRSS